MLELARSAAHQRCFGGRRGVMRDSKITSANRVLADCRSPLDIANGLGVPVPAPYQWMPMHSSAFSNEVEASS
jgi:hypothetical protein